MEKRIFNFLDWLKAEINPEDNVLLVAHGGTNIIIHSYFNSRPIDGNYLSFLTGNASCQIYRFEETTEK